MKKFNISIEDHREHEKLKILKSLSQKHSNTKNRENTRLEHISLIKEYLPDCSSILSIGSRHDSEVATFLNNGFLCQGIDVTISTDLIKLCDAHYLDKEFSSNQFDLVYCSHSLEHMVDHTKVLTNIRNVSKLGCLITLPSVNDSYAAHSNVYDIMNAAAKRELPDDLKALNHHKYLQDFKSFLPFELIYFKNKIKEKEFDLLFQWV
jgi:hypothetical protein